jgi:predicted transcriptional regulator
VTTDLGERRAQQQELYGAPLGDLAGRVMVALGLSQGRLASALGLSAPMLSQLISAQRVKIGNPAVVHRLQALLHLAESVDQHTPDEIAVRINEIRDEQATLTSVGEEARDGALATLRASATPTELRAAAAATQAPGLAALLLEAAGGAPRG